MATKFERIYSQIKTELEEIKEVYKYANYSMAFGHFMVKTLLDITDEEANESITDGSDDNGIDAVYIDQRTTKTVLHLFQFKFPQDSNTINRGVTQDELLKLCNGYEHFIANDEKFNSLSWNESLIDKRAELLMIECYDENVLHVVRFSTLENNDNIKVLESKINSLISQTGNDIVCDFKFAKEITEVYEKTRLNSWPDFNINFKKDLSPFEDPIAKILSYYVSLFSLYESLKKLDKDVFDGNVRYFDSSSKVNAGIVSTLEGDDCSRFHLLNNGITIVCSEAITNSMTDTIVIKKGSIVNGAQTVGCVLNVISKYIEDGKSIEKFKTSFVFIKVIKIDNKQELIDELVYTLNTQNQMKSSYSISNDPQVKAVQKEINNTTKYFLQVKNNEYNHQKTKNENFNKLVRDIIDIDAGIQAFVSYYNINDLAYLSKNNKALLFNEENRTLIVNELTKEKLVESYELYLNIMSITRNYRAYRKDKTKNEIISILEIEEKDIEKYKFINTGNYLILYALGLYCRKFNLSAENSIITVIKFLAPMFKKTSNISNLTKSKETFEKAKTMIEDMKECK